MSLHIVHYGDPVLRRKGERVTRFDEALARFAREMIDLMHAAGGIGLAAQQVGRAVQLCVVDLRGVETDFTWTLDGAKPPLDLFMPLTIVNPELTVPRGGAKSIREEGCLSFPDIRGDIVRPDETAVKFQDEHGVPHLLEGNGLLGRCLQHEIDHLNGVLFIDRMTPQVRTAIEGEVKALAKATRAAAKAGTT